MWSLLDVCAPGGAGNGLTPVLAGLTVPNRSRISSSPSIASFLVFVHAGNYKTPGAKWQSIQLCPPHLKSDDGWGMFSCRQSPTPSAHPRGYQPRLGKKRLNRYTLLEKIKAWVLCGSF
jgi:hypothetical protein